MESFRESYKEFIKTNKLIWKSKQRFGREKHQVFAEGVNRISMSANDDKRIHSINSIKIY